MVGAEQNKKYSRNLWSAFQLNRLYGFASKMRSSVPEVFLLKKIAIYGKGGIGKSTTTSNLSAALSHLGYQVMQIGCDPKADSTKNLCQGVIIPTVLDVLKEKENNAVTLEDIVTVGYNGVLCVESGGPTPGIGCAGRGIITAFEKLEELRAFETYQPDIVIYDVLGDVVCGGFAMPIRNGYAEDVFIVTSGEMMSMYAASNISSAVNQFKTRGYARVRGLILNHKNVENETALVQKLADEINTVVFHEVPRHPAIQEAENKGHTIAEEFLGSELYGIYEELATKIMAAE